MQMVGTANVYLLPVLFASAGSYSFSRTSWRASVVPAILFAGPKKSVGPLNSSMQEMLPEKEVTWREGAEGHGKKESKHLREAPSGHGEEASRGRET